MLLRATGTRKAFGFLFAAALVCPQPVLAAKAPETWDGLVKVKAKKWDLAYLKPGANFSGYTKVMLDPAQVAFRKNWQRDVNMDMAMSGRVSDSDVTEMLAFGREALGESFAKALQKAGFEIVTQPGSDVMRVSVAVFDVTVVAPDQFTSARVRVYSEEAGRATLAVEVRDSVSGELMGRAVDKRTVGDGMPYRRTSMSNRADFELLFNQWAKTSANGLTALKEATSAAPAP